MQLLPISNSSNPPSIRSLPLNAQLITSRPRLTQKEMQTRGQQGLQFRARSLSRGSDKKSQNLSPEPSGQLAKSGSTRLWQPRWPPKPKRSVPSLKAESDLNGLFASEKQLPSLPLGRHIQISSQTPPSLNLDQTEFGQPLTTNALFSSQRCQGSIMSSGQTQIALPETTESNMTGTNLIPKQVSVGSPPTLDCKHAGFEIQSAPLPLNSPALSNIISSFPSPRSRESLYARNQLVSNNRKNTWDGGETWDSEEEILSMQQEKHGPAQIRNQHQHVGFPVESSRPWQQLSRSPDQLYQRNLSPIPASYTSHSDLAANTSQSAGLADSAPTAISRPPLKQLTLEGGPPCSPSYQSLKSCRLLQRALQTSPHANVNSPDKGMVAYGFKTTDPCIMNVTEPSRQKQGSTMSNSPTSPSTSNHLTTSSASSSYCSLLSSTSSTGEIAKPSELLRDAIRQRPETPQNVWRGHAIGSSLPLLSPHRKLLKKTSSSPNLNNPSLHAAKELSVPFPSMADDASRADVEQRRSISYIPAYQLSFDNNSPSWVRHGHVSRGKSLDIDFGGFRKTYLNASAYQTQEKQQSPNFSRPLPEPFRLGAQESDAEAARTKAQAKLYLLQKHHVNDGVDDSSKLGSGFRLESPVQLSKETPTPCLWPYEEEDKEVLLDGDLFSTAHYQSNPANTVRSLRPAQSVSAISTACQQFGVTPVDSRPFRLGRTKSESGLSELAVSKRIPGQLHAWSVCISQNGTPSIRSTPSAFHHPTCSLAGKRNATWQCGCRGRDDESPTTRSSISDVARFSADTLIEDTATSTASRWPAFGRQRSRSVGNALDSALNGFGRGVDRKTARWKELEQPQQEICRHEKEVADLQPADDRISMEMSSSRPFFRSVPESEPRVRAETFGVSKAIASIGPEYRVADPISITPPIPDFLREPRQAPAPPTNPMLPLPTYSKAGGFQQLRRRLPSLSSMSSSRNLSLQSQKAGQESLQRLRSTSSTSSLNKMFTFGWSKPSASRKVRELPDPVPYPTDHQRHQPQQQQYQYMHYPEQPHPHQVQQPQQQHLYQPQPPELSSPTESISESDLVNFPVTPPANGDERRANSLFWKESSATSRKYPPTSRKYSFDTLHHPKFATSLSTRHTRGKSGSSKSSSNGTSILSVETPEGQDAKVGIFPKMIRRWDSISSRATSVSGRSAGGLSHHSTGTGTVMSKSSGARPSPEQTPTPMASDQIFVVSSTGPMAPPRRSSLKEASADSDFEIHIGRHGHPAENNLEQCMASITELSEVGTPSSQSKFLWICDVELSPASIAPGVAREGRMSMSERYAPNGLQVPISLPLSSDLSRSGSMISSSRSLDPSGHDDVFQA